LGFIYSYYPQTQMNPANHIVSYIKDTVKVPHLGKWVEFNLGPKLHATYQGAFDSTDPLPVYDWL